MENEDLLFKITFIDGLKDFVVSELKNFDIKIEFIKENVLFVRCDHFKVDSLLSLKSVIDVELCNINAKFNPKYLSNHKNILGKMIDKVLIFSTNKFKSYYISCAGSDTVEIFELKQFVEYNYKLVWEQQADLRINIGKIYDEWIISIRISNRPLSLRNWKVSNVEGGLNPTIAYCMNILSCPEPDERYLNVMSGSATLLIERAIYMGAKQLVGFDHDGVRNTLAIENIKKAKLIKLIQLNTQDIFNEPNFGQFRTITCDLPWGQLVGKKENLEDLYNKFLIYVSRYLQIDGSCVILTLNKDIVQKILCSLGLVIENEIRLKISTNTKNIYKVYINPIILTIHKNKFI